MHTALQSKFIFLAGYHLRNQHEQITEHLSF